MKITLFGLGEAGSLIAGDLAANEKTLQIHGYDPAGVDTPAGVIREGNPSTAVIDADLVLSLTAAADATAAMAQALQAMPKTAVYADFASASSTLKASLAKQAEQQQIAFCDVALMAIVPGNGVNAPVLVSGSGAARFERIMAPLGMPVSIVSATAGDAAQHKLLRSVTMKGLAAVLIEALEGAHKAGCAEWLWSNLSDELSKADGHVLERLVRGTQTHATRRLHEMQASQEQLLNLGVDPIMTRSTVRNLERVLSHGIPDIPNTTSSPTI